jgi:hypothetical protein
MDGALSFHSSYAEVYCISKSKKTSKVLGGRSEVSEDEDTGGLAFFVLAPTTSLTEGRTCL